LLEWVPGVSICFRRQAKQKVVLSHFRFDIIRRLLQIEVLCFGLSLKKK
jgi:hypothetical protein